MNGGEGYIKTEISQRRERPEKERRLLCDREELGIPILERGVPYPWDVEPLDFVCFSPPKQVVALSESNFRTHSLQIHCNGPSLKTVTPQYHIQPN